MEVFQLGGQMCIQVAEPTRWETEEFYLESFPKCYRAPRNCQAQVACIDQTTSGVFLVHMPYAKASTTEEPDAGKPHVRVCAGGAG